VWFQTCAALLKIPALDESPAEARMSCFQFLAFCWVLTISGFIVIEKQAEMRIADK